MAPPTEIVLVHGYWEGPSIWRNVVPEVEKVGFNDTTIKLLSTGTPASESPKSPSMVRNANPRTSPRQLVLVTLVFEA